MVKTEKKNTVKKSFYNEVKSELKKVKWPSKKEMIKYSVSTLCFVILFALFFFGIENLFAFVKGLIG